MLLLSGLVEFVVMGAVIVGRSLRTFKVPALTGVILLTIELALALTEKTEGPSSLTPLLTYSSAEDRAEIILLGSSRLRGIDAAVLSPAAGGSAVNLAYNGGSAEAHQRVTARYLAPALAHQTRLLVLGLGPMDLNDSYRSPVLAASVWTVGDFLRHVLDHGTDSETRSFLLSRPPASWSSLLRGYAKNRLRADVRGLALRFEQRLNGEAPEQPEERDEGVDRGALKAQGAHRIEAVPPPTHSLYLRDFHLGGRQTTALEAWIHQVKQAGVTPVLVDIPVSRWYAHAYVHGEDKAYREHLWALGQRLDVPVFLLTLEDYGLFDADYFKPDGRFDGHHLVSSEGRARFGQRLGEFLRPLLAARREGRSVGFSHGRRTR